MLCFTTATKEIGVAPDAPGAEWELKLQTMDEIKPACRLRRQPLRRLRRPAAGAGYHRSASGQHPGGPGRDDAAPSVSPRRARKAPRQLLPKPAFSAPM